jgi:hypothetical protein
MAADVRLGEDDRCMWIVDVVCSDPDCAETREAIVKDLDEVERVVCDCECSVVALTVGAFEPVYAA